MRDKPPKILPADKSHMAEIHKMFLPATIRNRVISPIKGVKRNALSVKRTGTSPVPQNPHLPASMKRRGIRGKTFCNNTHTYVEPVKIDDCTKYKTVEVNDPIKTPNRLHSDTIVSE